MKPIHEWMNREELATLYSSNYWNSIESEMQKPWWIENGEYGRCERYLRDTRLMLEYEQSEAWLRDMGRGSLRVADIAAGIGWTSALLSKLECVAEVHAVEFSVHRLERLFPHAVRMFAARDEKISRYLGSFYDLHLAPASMDVVYLSQAFHHADKPLHLLMECDRVLAPGGRVLVIGEPHVTFTQYLRRMFGYAMRKRRFTRNFYELFPPDVESGDHYYRHSDYYFMFGALGYRVGHRVLASGNVAFVADKPN